METFPSILRNKVIQPVDAHFIASPSADITYAHNSSLTTTTTASAMFTADPEKNRVPNNQIDCAPNNLQSQSASNHNPVINKQSKIITVILDNTTDRRVISYERENSHNYRKPSSESDRKLYNKQLQIITNTMEASASFSASASASKCRNQQHQQQQSQIKTVFQRYSENDEFSLAMCDAYSNEEYNNNRALI